MRRAIFEFQEVVKWDTQKTSGSIREFFFVVVAQGSLGGCKESGAEVLKLLEEGVLTLPIVVSTHTLGAQQPRSRGDDHFPPN